jgi:PAS domain S-box-containing protein
MRAGQDPEIYLESALTALASGGGWHGALDALPVPAYVTDAGGAVTYWNQACVKLAGRVPQLGKDRWCVTWKIYTMTGERLPHDQCPMAQAIKEERIVRDSVAIAERPDGTRIAFRPYPTPLFDDDGALTGAVNLLIDVTDEQSDSLAEQADRCRRLAGALYSRESNTVLQQMAERFDRTAADLRKPADNDE